MAKVIQDNVVLTISKIARDDEGEDAFVTSEQKAAIEQIVAEVVGAGYVVEVL